MEYDIKIKERTFMIFQTFLPIMVKLVPSYMLRDLHRGGGCCIILRQVKREFLLWN